jgi:hypothetical protein
MKPDADPRISRRTILTYGPVLGAAAAVAPAITGCALRATSGETNPVRPHRRTPANLPKSCLNPSPFPVVARSTMGP